MYVNNIHIDSNGPIESRDPNTLCSEVIGLMRTREEHS